MREKSEIGAVLPDVASRGVPLAKATLDAFFERYGAAAATGRCKRWCGTAFISPEASHDARCPRCGSAVDPKRFSAKECPRLLLEAIPVQVVTDVASPIQGHARCALDSLDDG